MDLETIKEWWDFLLPMLPYIGTVLVTHQLMARGVKPMLARNRDPETKVFYTKGWARVRHWMWTYPSIIGALIGVGYKVSAGEANIFYHMLCGTSAQMLVHFARDFAKSKGYDVEEVRDTLTPPPASDPPPPEE